MFKSLFAILAVISVSALQAEGKRRDVQNPVCSLCVFCQNSHSGISDAILREILRTLKGMEMFLTKGRGFVSSLRPTYPMGGNRPHRPNLPGRPPFNNSTSKAEMFKPERLQQVSEDNNGMNANNKRGFQTERPPSGQLEE